MAKFGWDDDRLFNVESVALQNLGSTPSENPDAGQLKLYFKSGDLYKLDSGGVETKIDTGETNTASNQNVGGVGVFKQKTGVDLEFYGINAASSKITVALDAGNNEIDIDADASAIIADLALGSGVVKATGGVLSADADAADLPYDNATSGLTATNVQAAIDELDSTIDSISDHGNLSGLSDDDHTQYALLAGRSGGQTLIGGTDPSDDLVLQSTSDASQGNVTVDSADTFKHGKMHKVYKELQTTDATLTDSYTLTLPANKVVHIKAYIVSRRSDGGGQARGAWELQAYVYRDDVSAALLEGSVKQNFLQRSDNAIDADIAVSGNDVKVQVQGKASEDHEWSVYVEAMTSN